MHDQIKSQTTEVPFNEAPILECYDRMRDALRTFPLPSSGATSLENYQRVLEWLYGPQPSVASLVIDLAIGEHDA